MFVCLCSSNWSGEGVPPAIQEALAPALLKIVPRAVFGRGLIWADAHSLDAQSVAARLTEALEQRGGDQLTVGVSRAAIAAEVAARHAIERGLGTAGIFISPGEERTFLARFPIGVLEPSAEIRPLLEGVGIETCSDLACLTQDAVEVRFGAEGVKLWRLSRADDRRSIFPSGRRAHPEASLEWVDYVLTNPERLIFVINALAENVCTELVSRGQGAREMKLMFSLANGRTFEHLVRPARATSSRRAWMRLIRARLDEIRLPDAVSGITLRVESVSAITAKQGDIFDRGFATAGATEETVAQLLDDQGAVIVIPQNSRHPLLDRRTHWVAQEPSHAVSATIPAREERQPGLTLQLLQAPRRIDVKTARRRDHDLPLKYRDTNSWVLLESAAGPDRISGGQWEQPYAREYFRCLAEDGSLLWIFRDCRAGEWYLHGWWD